MKRCLVETLSVWDAPNISASGQKKKTTIMGKDCFAKKSPRKKNTINFIQKIFNLNETYTKSQNEYGLPCRNEKNEEKVDQYSMRKHQIGTYTKHLRRK